MITTLPRLRGCGRYRRPDFEGVGVALAAGGVAHLTGVQSCGSVWACPVCSAVIRSLRAAQVERAAKAHLAAGGGLLFATLTVPHTVTDDLEDLLDGVVTGWHAIRKHRAVAALVKSLGWQHFIRSVEITHGRNGWHPHLHVLLFLDAPPGPDSVVALESAMYAAWSAFAIGSGRAAPAIGVGVRVQPVSGDNAGAEALAAYLTKVQDGFDDERSLGMEMMRGDLKTGRKGSRTPFELLAAGPYITPRDVALWREYERATKGRRCMEWSRKLRALYGINDDEEDLAGEQPAAVQLATFSEREWALVVKFNAQVRVLEQAEDKGISGIWALIEVLATREQYERERPRRRYGGSQRRRF